MQIYRMEMRYHVDTFIATESYIVHMSQGDNPEPEGVHFMYLSL